MPNGNKQGQRQRTRWEHSDEVVKDHLIKEVEMAPLVTINPDCEIPELKLTMRIMQ